MPDIDNLGEAVGKAVGLMLAGETDKLEEFLRTLPADVMEPLAAITLPRLVDMVAPNPPERLSAEMQIVLEIKEFAGKHVDADKKRGQNLDKVPIKMTTSREFFPFRWRWPLFLDRHLRRLEHLSILIGGIGLFGGWGGSRQMGPSGNFTTRTRAMAESNA